MCDREDPRFLRAIREIESAYGDIVSIDSKRKDLRKFGKHPSLGTSFETIWHTTGDETYATTNAITHFSSSSASDTMQMVIEGRTVAGTGVDAEYTFVTQTVTVDGQNKTALTTPLARATRYYVDDSSDLVGTFYVYEDDTVTDGVPQTQAKIHLSGDRNQSRKASTTISKNDYWLITQVYAAVELKTSAIFDFDLEIRNPGKVFRNLLPGSASTNGGDFSVILDTPLIVPKNSDFRIRGAASAANVEVIAWASGPLAWIED